MEEEKLIAFFDVQFRVNAPSCTFFRYLLIIFHSSVSLPLSLFFYLSIHYALQTQNRDDLDRAPFNIILIREVTRVLTSSSFLAPLRILILHLCPREIIHTAIIYRYQLLFSGTPVDTSNPSI